MSNRSTSVSTQNNSCTQDQSNDSNNSNNNNCSTPSTPTKTKHSNIPRTYSGMYGQGGHTGGDLLPFELARNRNTDWAYENNSMFLLTYLLLLFVAQICVMAVTAQLWRSNGTNGNDSLDISWTITNALHGFITLLYFHWIKGSPNFYDIGGEMNGMTFWEQIESSPNSINEFHFFIQIVFIVPTILCHLACHFGQYQPIVVSVNVCVWLGLVIIPKMSFMNGVRILGINRTAGIDDYDFWWKISQWILLP